MIKKILLCILSFYSGLFSVAFFFCVFLYDMPIASRLICFLLACLMAWCSVFFFQKQKASGRSLSKKSITNREQVDTERTAPPSSSIPAVQDPAPDDSFDELFFRLTDWKEKYFVDNGSRTSERQKATLQILLRNPKHDLYRLSAHGTTCAFCAPREGRVYSKSGNDPIFPPLALAFQKIDKDGPDVLWNTYLITHPNTLHVISEWTPAGRTETEIEEVKHFSSLATNPLSHDPRTDLQKEMYHKKQVGRKKWLRRYHLFERCSHLEIENFPKTYKTFEKHALSNSAKYQAWMRQYSDLMQK